ncbi:MAG TPA: carbohydrate porin [Hyphomonadaceae bacterium]|jgi:porin|nr:carbohydrate porin [Hyphomonadaceae bacterium]
MRVRLVSSLVPIALGIGLLLAGQGGVYAQAPASSSPGEEGTKESAVSWGLVYKADLAGVLVGGTAKAGRLLDNLELTGEASLEDLGWKGARIYGHLLSNTGGTPNDIAQTLQGIDNIEVGRHRAKLYQLWLEQSVADDRGSFLVGLYDLNSEFYQTEAAGLLLAPAFGIGSELAATGPNGPSIFPSTALAFRARWSLTKDQYIQGAVLNASAGVLGDPGGVDLSFDNGALLVGEWVGSGDATLRLGAWTYTEKQDDIRDVDGAGDPVKRAALGVYATLEGPLGSWGDTGLSGFVRAGAADGRTTSYLGGWQAGILASPVFTSRPDSAFSVGLNQGLINARERANARDAGMAPSSGESAIEITYADKLSEHITLQPDLQFIGNPGADSARDAVVVATLRATIEY